MSADDEIVQGREDAVDVPQPEDEVTPEASDSAAEPVADADIAAADDHAQPEAAAAGVLPAFGLIFQAPEPAKAPARRARRAPAASSGSAAQSSQTEPESAEVAEPEAADPDEASGNRRRKRGGRGRRGKNVETEMDADSTTESAVPAAEPDQDETDDAEGEPDAGSRRRRRRRRASSGAGTAEDPPGTVTRVRAPRASRDEVTAVKGSTRLEAKKQRRREGREAGRRRTIITEAEFLARRESVERVMVVREHAGRTQIAVLEDKVLVEHYVSREQSASLAGNVYLGRVQNVLPSMEAAFVDIGKGRNAVLYAGEVNWDAAGLEGNLPKRIENALTSGDTVLVQVTKDPMGHKGARLTAQVSLPGRFLVFVPQASMTGISRKLPDTERARLKAILKEIVPADAGVIVRTAAEGASEAELRGDVERLTRTWEQIQAKAEKASKRKGSGGAPLLLHGEPDLTIRVIRDVFNEDFTSLIVQGDNAWREVSAYVEDVAPDLAERVTKWTGSGDVFATHRVDEQLAKALDRKVWLPSGGSLVIDRTEAMTVIDVNTGKFVGSGGNLEETVTKNNLEAAEEIVRQLRLRDLGGIIVVDFIDMVLESNRDLVVRRLLECLGRDRTKHQVAEVTSLGLVQMTRKRVGTGLLEAFSEPCPHCAGRGVLVQAAPVDAPARDDRPARSSRSTSRQAPPQHNERTGPSASEMAAVAHAAAMKVVAHAAPVDLVEASAGDESPESGNEHPSPVSEDPDQTAAQAHTPDKAEPDDLAAPSEVAQTPAPRKRRRGRVVAAAGPPGGTEVSVVGTQNDASLAAPTH